MNTTAQFPSHPPARPAWLRVPARFFAALAFLACVRLAAADASSTVAITTTTLPPLVTGTPFSVTITATGGTTPYTWSLPLLPLPAGLSLNASTGQITGSPLTAGNSVIFVRVTDQNGAATQRGWNVPITQGTSSGGSGTATPPPPPPPTTYTVNVTNGTIGSGSSTTANFTPGTNVSVTAAPAPAGQWFKQWNGNAVLGNSFAATTTFTMPASNVTLTALYFTPATVPQPVTGHPRLWINQSDVANLRQRAVSSNPVYQNLLPLLSTCVTNYQTKFYPGGQPNPVNPDLGDTQGYAGLLSEQHALVFALFSLIDPDPTARIQHAQRARNLIMRAMDEAVKGHAAGQPFRDPMFPLFNRANFTSECWPLAVDWIYSATLADGITPVLSSADKKTIRDVFLLWANDCLNAYVCGGDHPAPLGTVNSTALLPNGSAHRVAANNYYAGHARLVTLMSLCLDPADDAAVNPAAPLSVLGNSLRSYIPNATGAWLYQQFAMFGDPAAVKSAFNLPASASVGLASGGLSPEGGLYGHAFSYTLGQLLALKTAGFADPTLSGPQAALVTAPVWDRYLAGFAHSIAPAAKVYPNQAWLGPIYSMASYGDVLRLWITPDFMQVFALKNLLDQKNGNRATLDASRWFAVNAVEGGAAGLAQRIQNPWSWGVQNAVLYFLLLDPSLPAPADPRPAYATTFYDAGNGRVLARTDWSAGASIFTFRSSWESINHQDGDAGQFELYRKGEWLTKELSNYDNNGNGQSSMWHNSLALQNWCANGTPHLNYFEQPYWPNGSQWNNGASAGDPVTTTSSGPGYTYAQTDLTKLYNRPDFWTAANSAVDITHASRSILWLSGDYIVVYDRATSLHNGFKRFNLNFAATPVIDSTARSARVSTPGGQKVFVQTLLPTTATLTYVPVANSVAPIAELETMTGRLVVEDPARPTDVRFLHVIQGADGSANAATPTATVQSTAGTTFDGAIVGSCAVLFPRTFASPFVGTSYATPAAVTSHVVTGLAPNTGYTASTTSDGITTQITVTAAGPLVTDSNGVLTFATP